MLFDNILHNFNRHISILIHSYWSIVFRLISILNLYKSVSNHGIFVSDKIQIMSTEI